MRLIYDSQSKLSEAESQWHDLLRIFLLMQVVFGHISGIALPTIPELWIDSEHNWPLIFFRIIWRFGAQAAYLFIFLSGFMVAGPLLANISKRQKFTAQEFFSRRLRRIFPIAAVAVFLTALLDTLARAFPGAEEFYHRSYAYDMFAAFNWVNFVGNLLFLQPIAVDSFGSNGPLWTLGYIVQYYVIGWILFSILKRNQLFAITSLLLTLTIMSAIDIEWSLLFLAWVAGGISRHLFIPKRLTSAFLLSGIIFLISSNIFHSIALIIPSGFFLTVALHNSSAVPSILSGSWLRKISNDSYTIYATHHPVLMCIYAIVFSGAASTNLLFSLYFVIAFVAVLGVSIAVNKLVTYFSISR